MPVTLPSTHGLQKVIYDLGSNNGDNIAYYLKKAGLVVAVEANPTLAEHIRQRFEKQITDGALVVENCVLTAGKCEVVPFYLNKHSHVWSQFPKPEGADMQNFDEVMLPARNVVELVRQYGAPYYIKIDIERYDHVILQALFSSGIHPDFISAEAHTIEVFALLLAAGRYQSFNLVDGKSVSTKYSKHRIKTDDPQAVHSFPYDSAGPFGEDIAGAWMTPNNFFRFLAYEQLGWKDIHATNLIAADAGRVPRLRTYVQQALRFQFVSGLQRIAKRLKHPLR
jgi:FkbM family methyltransferase